MRLRWVLEQQITVAQAHDFTTIPVITPPMYWILMAIAWSLSTSPGSILKTLSNEKTMSEAMEITTFQLAKGLTIKDFVAANTDVDAWLRKQPGFILRRICEGSDG